MKFSKLFTALFFIIFIFHKNANALEIYSFIDDKKQNNSGFVLGVDKTNLTLLSLEGKLNVIKKENVTALYVYNIVQNPIKILNLNSQMAVYLRDVYLTDKDSPSFTGFPVQMIDEMVIFFDLSGKIHVQVLTDIVKLRKYDFKKNVNIQLSNYKKLILNIDDQNGQSRDKSISELSVYPTKIFKGKININKYLIKTRNNFTKIYSYQERTFLYAKPMIFDQDFKLGINFLYRKIPLKEGTTNMYLQWSTGSAYGFQSKTAIGATDSEWLPELFPMGIIQSEVKTHFFNTLFVGNLGALPAGTRNYTIDGDNTTYTNSLIYSYDPYVEINYNYMLLLGGDYGPFSASFGMFYPIYAMNINNHIREIAPPKTSPAFRFIYLKRNLKLKAIFSVTDYSGKNGDINKNVFARYAGGLELIDITEDGFVYQDDYGYSEYENDDASPITKYNLDSYYLRLGLVYNLTRNLKLGLDGILVDGKYSETFNPQDIIAGNNTTYQLYKNGVKFRHYNAGLYLHHRFSDYVAIKATLNYYYNTYDYDFFNNVDETELIKCEYGGAFELIF